MTTNGHSHSTKRSICVFCGSARGKSDAYALAAEELANEMAKRNWDLVYGGGSTGIMGVMASSVIKAGQSVTGIIPRALTRRERDGEVPAEIYGETILVDDMHTRKRMMAERGSAFVSLPGGLGTLEEMFEVATWNQLGIHRDPVVLFNVNGFYDHLIAFIKHAVQEGFIGETQQHIIVEAKTAVEVCEAIENYVPATGRLNLSWKSVTG
ncbi:protein of unknown function [Taphrina deformans PYCC 5710]|uniref:Cytokinin riboside 5'-monophosphate phosphoribohydrolase n=1 Tax=Taphrina deformans (strain PYCC 5710 / ATCC 11124 / CBS 356.35 / IMI 108563 / JCM 9778 / NBRC 8474) TaxID=1097556 RepID=R4XM85_TAPDE|nr:protein of unknown function [Taphrina deformans PYCC 5710]|eukprot:CCG84410.1 protein of unknown function [Taphrina deformans PYCC 5710]